MSYGVMFVAIVAIYVVGFFLTSAVVGWISDEFDGCTATRLEDALQVLLVAGVWPVFWIISTPILARRLRNYIYRRRAIRLARLIQVEAEAKVLRDKKARSAHLRPIRRRMDLSK